VASLSQLSPRTLAEILVKATPNDDFIQFNGAGYYYPDLYGKGRRYVQALELQAERLRSYMDLTGIRILAFNFQNWNGTDARAACETFASRLPGLLGILAFQYSSYSVGNGAIYWVKGVGGDEVPVVSCRLCVWAQTGRPRDTTPARVAAQLNGLPKSGDKTSADCFSWVLVHAWSRFRRAEKGAPLDAEEKDVPQDRDTAETARGYDPALWAIERLNPNVKAVTAQELLLRIRLRLHPQATLSRWLTEAEAAANPTTGIANRIAEAHSLLKQTNLDSASAARCFELIKGTVQL
jgi:hypothetical protein